MQLNRQKKEAHHRIISRARGKQAEASCDADVVTAKLVQLTSPPTG